MFSAMLLSPLFIHLFKALYIIGKPYRTVRSCIEKDFYPDWSEYFDPTGESPISLEPFFVDGIVVKNSKFHSFPFLVTDPEELKACCFILIHLPSSMPIELPHWH